MHIANWGDVHFFGYIYDVFLRIFTKGTTNESKKK